MQPDITYLCLKMLIELSRLVLALITFRQLLQAWKTESEGEAEQERYYLSDAEKVAAAAEKVREARQRANICNIFLICILIY